MEHTEKKQGSSVTIFLIILIIIVGALLLLNNNKVTVEPIPEEGINQEELENLEAVMEEPELSEESDIETIEAELEATSFDELEADLNSLEF